VRILISVAFLVLMTTAGIAADIDYAKVSNEELIGALQAVDCPAPGLNGTGIYQAFIADDSHPALLVGVLGQPAPCLPPQMRELVRRGTEALPALIRHLEDARPTKLLVGGTFGNGIPYMFEEYGDEYEPKRPVPPVSRPAYIDEMQKNGFRGTYTVKIGDVCFALIGQIVNRSLIAVRYQPSAGLIVNSPVQRPELAALVRADWNDADLETLRASLLSDIHASKNRYQSKSALARLRFYFPDVYSQLAGDDLTKRKEFEDKENLAR
jgi:hypothetical protein